MIDEGSAAEQGAAVLTIDPERRTLERDSARARVTESHAALVEQERDFERIKELHAEGRRVADAARPGRDAAQARAFAALGGGGGARHAGARARRRDRARALRGADRGPLVSRGEYVAPGQKLFELVSLDPIEVEFRLTEIDSSRVKIGNDVDVRVAPFPDETFRATVTIVSPTIDPRTRTLRVKAQLANAERHACARVSSRASISASRSAMAWR